MIHFVTQNIGTLITCVILLIIVGLAIRSIVVSKKKGKSTCGCGCANCPSASVCHKIQN